MNLSPHTAPAGITMMTHYLFKRYLSMTRTLMNDILTVTINSAVKKTSWQIYQ